MSQAKVLLTQSDLNNIENALQLYLRSPGFLKTAEKNPEWGRRVRYVRSVLLFAEKVDVFTDFLPSE